MGSAFSFNEDFRLRLVQNIQSNIVNNVDEILTCIKEFRLEISMKIEKLEQKIEQKPSLDREIAVLIRQDQYLEALSKTPKSKLDEIFFSSSNQDSGPRVLKWYKKD